MKRPVAAFVLALVSVMLSPMLVAVEVPALLFADMVTYEPANSPVVKAVVVAVVVVIGLLAFTMPVIALVMGIRVRAESRSLHTRPSGLAMAATVIAAIVIVGVLASQAYLALLAAGVCSLEGCGP